MNKVKVQEKSLNEGDCGNFIQYEYSGMSWIRGILYINRHGTGWRLLQFWLALTFATEVLVAEKKTLVQAIGLELALALERALTLELEQAQALHFKKK